DLRNLVVHTYSRTTPLALPSPHAVERIEAIQHELLSPPRLIQLFRRKVEICGPNDLVGQAARRMLEGCFSQLPVYRDSRLVGLLTTDTIARWLASRLADGIGLLEEELVEKVLPHEEQGREFRLLAHEATVFDALEAFEEASRHGRRLH